MRTLTIVLLLAACKYQTGSTGTQIEGPDAGPSHDGPCHNGVDGGRDPLPDGYIYTNDGGSYYPDAGTYYYPDGGYGGQPDAGSYYYPDAAPPDAH